MRVGGKIGENFLLAKFPAIRYNPIPFLISKSAVKNKHRNNLHKSIENRLEVVLLMGIYTDVLLGHAK